MNLTSPKTNTYLQDHVLLTKGIGESFMPIPCPKASSDWLARIKEPGQSVGDFISDIQGSNFIQSSLGKSLGLIKLGNVSQTRMEEVARFIQIYFGIKVVELSKMELQRKRGRFVLMSQPGMAQETFRVQHRHHEGNIQLDASDVLNYLKHALPDECFGLLCISRFDLYEDDTDNYIAGNVDS